jgi:putative DNA primase/helicase
VNWTNYDDALAQLRAMGLLVDGLGPDDIGTRKRCKIEGDREKRGWYHLHELRTDSGDTLLVGSFGVWQGNDPGTQKLQIKGTTLSADQRAALKTRIAADQAKARIKRQGEANRAAARASAMWSRLATSGDSEYLTRKGISGHGARYSPTGSLIVPMLDVGGGVHGLQVIYPKGHDKAKLLGRDKNYWPAGVVKEGHFFLIGSPAAAAVLLLAEGYATGASLFEATGIPVAVAFDAGNLLHVAQVLAARYRGVRILVCADDDYLVKCPACKAFTLAADATCQHCGEQHRRTNAGITSAAAAALAVDGAWIAPRFAAERPTDRKGPTDFNDLHLAEGLHVVRAQVEAHLSALDWRPRAPSQPPAHTSAGEGAGAARDHLVSLTDIGQLHQRFTLVYEMTDVVFDEQEHKLVPLSSMRNLCVSRQMHRGWMESAAKRIARAEEVGFDPGGRDPRVRCNLWGGWPTTPVQGCCDKLLELGEYLCSEEASGAKLWRWVQCWLAYPIQNPGAKMKTALVLHGPQGTGKNLFFEAVKNIYGEYGRVVDQDAVEDKFNDVMSRKLFVIADEVVARQELYHTKNKLKGLITGDEIRINQKNISSYVEVNHINLVFLSNETLPMVLERDDRRYAIIWTPPKLDAAFYNQVLAEIRDGGVAALHHHLLHLDLGDFGPATLPPMTQAKADVIEQSLDSSERFFNEWIAGHLPVPVSAVRTEDLYDAYRHWCTRQGVAKPAQMSTLIGSLSKRPGVRKNRPRHYDKRSRTTVVQSTVLYPPTADAAPSLDDLSDALAAFGEAFIRWKTPIAAPGTAGSGNASYERPQPPDDDPY